jgi:REP element-mobilizing transposase RayT
MKRVPDTLILPDSEFATLAEVIVERREEHGFVLTAWVFLPDHWHAIFYPRHPLTISTVMEAIKDGATKRINRGRREAGMLWQPRFFDRALRTVREYNEKVEYIHLDWEGYLTPFFPADTLLPFDILLPFTLLPS